MNAIQDPATLRIMARNTWENAIVKNGNQDEAAAEDAYRQALRYSQEAIDLAQSDHDRMSAERLHAMIEQDFQSRKSE